MLTGYAYVTPFDPVQHFAFVHGDIGDGEDVPTRLHRVDIIADVIRGGVEVKKVFARFKSEGRGVFIYLRDGAAGVPARRELAGGLAEQRGAADPGMARRRRRARRSCAISASARSGCGPVRR